jgi:hypothetical protein
MKFDNFSGCQNISKTEIKNPDFIIASDLNTKGVKKHYKK